MKFVAVTIFTLLLLTQTFSKWLLVWEYNVNKEYIASNLCENRSRPILKCNGKCQLMKKMAAEEAAASKSSSGTKTAKNVFSEVWCDTEFPGLQQTNVSLSTLYSDYYQVANYSAPTSSIFHPPLV